MKTVVVALVVFGLAVAAVGLRRYVRLVDPFRVDVASWIGDITEGAIVLVATLALLAFAFASGKQYAYVAAAAIAGTEAIEVWLLWLTRRLREAPGRTTVSVRPRLFSRADGSRRDAALR